MLSNITLIDRGVLKDMLNLSQCSPDNMRQFGHSILYNNQNLANLTEAANVCVKELYDNFRQPNGEPAFSLIRVFRTCRYDDLPPRLKQMATPDFDRWLALMATIGVEEDWCEVRKSKSNQLNSLGGQPTPMFNAAFKQMGISLTPEDQQQSLENEGSASSSRCFYVPDVPGNSKIPAQEHFVEPYGIQSVIGLGGQFSSDEAVLILCFAKVSITEQCADTFEGLTNYLPTLLSYYDVRGDVWDMEN
jgi:hypothetical protein